MLKTRILWRLTPTLNQSQTYCLVIDKQTGLIYVNTKWFSVGVTALLNNKNRTILYF